MSPRLPVPAVRRDLGLLAAAFVASHGPWLAGGWKIKKRPMVRDGVYSPLRIEILII